MTRERLDLTLMARGLAATRSRARDLVRRGTVFVDGRAETKPGTLVAPLAEICLAPGAGGDRVSRGAVKIEAGLAAFDFEVRGRIALDVGASTGGFTEILLERGAARVYAIDVGRGQLHPRLSKDPRVVSREGCDARALGPDIVPEAVGCIVADVSFVALSKALPNALALAAPGAWLLALVKPQFESRPADIGKGGIVRNESVRDAAVARVAAWLNKEPGWRVRDVIPSPIAGGSGNREFLLGAAFDG